MKRIALVLLPILLLAGCSTSAASTPASSSPHSIRSAPAASAPAAGPATPAQVSCSDPKGDGDGFDVRRVDVARVGDVERVTLTLSKAPDFAAHESASAVLSLYDATGNHGAVLTTKWLPGETSVSVFDLDATMNTYVDDLTVQSGKTVQMSYPAKLVDRAGAGWVWTLATTLDGVDVDACSTSGYESVVGA